MLSHLQPMSAAGPSGGWANVADSWPTLEISAAAPSMSMSCLYMPLELLDPRVLMADVEVVDSEAGGVAVVEVVVVVVMVAE
jgi:hypothetical protein